MPHAYPRASAAGIGLVAVLVVLTWVPGGWAQGGVWTTRADMPIEMGPLASAVNGKLYVTGVVGDFVQDPVPSSAEYEYDPDADTWTQRAAMPTPRYDCCQSEVAGGIYVMGGFSDTSKEDWGLVATVEMYDPRTDTWARKADMPTARGGCAAVTVDGRIYTIGGYTASAADTRTVEVYDPATDTWTRKAGMPTSRKFPAAAVVNGIIYAVGGNSWVGDLKDVEAYDPVADTWTTKASLPKVRNGLAAVEVDGRVFAIGGAVFQGQLAWVDEYDPATDTWTSRTPMPTPKWMGGTAVIDGRIFALGGGVGSGSRWRVLRSVEVYEPDRSYLLQSAVRTGPALVVGRTTEFPMEVTLKAPLADGTFPELQVDLSLVGDTRTVSLARQAGGHYAGTVRVTPTVSGEGQYLPVRMLVPGASPRYLYSVTLPVWPPANLPLFDDGMGAGWNWRTVGKVTLDSATAVPAFQGARVLRVESTGSWNVFWQPTIAIDPFGYTALHFALRPADKKPALLKARLTCSPTTTTFDESPSPQLDLLPRVDWNSQSWQEVQIPLDSLGLAQDEAVTEVRLAGSLTGTLYLDDIHLVAASPPATVVEEAYSPALPQGFVLDQNHPNPFNSSTAIGFALPTQEQVELALYNLAGQRVLILMQGQRAAGVHRLTWDGLDDQGRALASGVYVCRLRAGDQHIQARKLLLVR